MRGGFTLVELMIVVAIIGILAAIAVPNFLEMQYKAKRSEIPANIDGIQIAEIAYATSYDDFLASAATPSSTPGKLARAWPGGAPWSAMGWAPDGLVRGSYAVAIATVDFTITASCDVDGDGVVADYTGTVSTNATLATADLNTY